MRLCLSAAALILSQVAGATTLVITHPERGFDSKSYAGPATTELLRSTSFKNKLVLMVYPDRSEYTFDPAAEGVSFTRRVSTGGQIEEDLGDTDFVVGGGFLSACMQDTVTDLIQYSGAKTVRVAMAAAYLHAPMYFWPGATSTAPRTLEDFAQAAAKSAEPMAARLVVVDIGARIQSSLNKRGIKRQVVVHWRGKPLAQPRGPAPDNRVVLNFE